MAPVVWGRELAEVYDTVNAAEADPAVLDPMLGVLVDLAGGGDVLEFAAGTGRVALALAARGVRVQGVELSPAMAEQFRRKPGAAAVPLTVGDMATTRVEGEFALVYLVANSLMNLTTQDEQTAVFTNAAAHLAPGGCFVVELIVPRPGDASRVFTMLPDHVGIETVDDPVGQIAWSHHWMEIDGRLVRHSAPYRYVWPAELDLMARLAGLRVWERWAGWDRAAFTAESASQVVVFTDDRRSAQSTML